MSTTLTTPDSESRRFVRGVAIFSVALSAALIGLILLIDPFGVSPIQARRIGYNAVKTERTSVDRLVKPADILIHQPATLVFGSSRIKEGIDPAAIDGSPYAPGYNFGVDFAGLRYIDEMLKTTLRYAPGVKVLLIEVYATHFFDLKPAEGKAWPQLLHDGASMTASWPALKAAGLTLVKNRVGDDHRSYLRPNGLVEMWNTDMVQDYRAFLDTSARLYKDSPSDIGAEQLGVFESISASCKAQNIRCIYFLPPVHPVHLATEYIQGRWPLLQDMKQFVMQFGEVYDFTLLTPMSHEPIRPQMTYWYDVNHFRQNVGDMMMRRIFHGDDSVFGARLTPERLATDNAVWEWQIVDWMAQNPDAVDRLYETMGLQKP